MVVLIDIFKALSEENRIRILALLMHGEMCVCEIEECLKMTQPNVSRHLSALKNSGMLDSYKQAQWAYYKISSKFKKENQHLWLYLEQMLKQTPQYQKDLAAYEKCKEQDICASRTP